MDRDEMVEVGRVGNAAEHPRASRGRRFDGVTPIPPTPLSPGPGAEEIRQLCQALAALGCKPSDLTAAVDELGRIGRQVAEGRREA